MSGRRAPQLPATRRAEPAFREQRRQKFEEYLLRKKAISGLLVPERQTNTSSNRIVKAANDKPQDKIKVLKSAKQKMEDKENANRPPWNQPSDTLEKITAPSKSETLKRTTILTNSTVGTNCGLEDFSAAIHASKDETVEIKTYHVSFSQSFLHKRNLKEKQLIAEKRNSNASLPKKHIPGSYCGKIISSKINSFRKTLENEDAKSSLANKKPVIPATKPAVRPSVSSNDVIRNNIRASHLPSAAKPINTTSFQKKPPMSASHVTHSKPIQNKEKPIVTKVSINNTTGHRASDRSGPPPSLKIALRDAKFASVPGAKKTDVPLKDVRSGTSTKSVSVTCVTKATQDSKAGNRKHVLPKESADERRIRLAEWKAAKGKVIKRPSCTLLQVAQPETQTSQTQKEPVESFWATIAEEDEQGLFSENVNKTLAECLHLTEQGYPGDEIRAMLEKLIQRVPDAKKLAKYWVCCMRLEQKGPIEKIIAVYEEAVLAGAQPKDELRHAVADIMKNNENLPKSIVEEGVKEELVGKEANSFLQNVEEVFKELNLNVEKAEISEDVMKEETDSSVKPKQETLPKEDKKHRNKEQSKKSANYKTEGTALEFKTPDKEKEEGSYLIKYNLSTTPYLESVKKKMQCEANDSAVKDIKFLTPVRRSRRLQEKLYKLPNMLKDHDPCVSSLEQLGELGTVTNAFIYRRNSALQEPATHLEEQEEE